MRWVLVTFVALIAACGPGERPSVAQSGGAGEPARYAGIVAGHNQARRAVGVPDLQWSAELAGVAQGWANTLQGESCNMRHSQHRGIGENLHWSSGRPDTPATAIAGWLAERQFFDAATKTCAPGKVSGHYTQMVWRSTQFVGCGMAACGNKEIWVCNYSPPGNYVGQAPF